MALNKLSDTEAERSFVGSLIAASGDGLEMWPVTPEHFLDPVSYAIFAEIRHLREACQPITCHTVMHRFMDDGERVEKLGGFGDLLAIINFPVRDLAGYYFEQVDAKLTLRRGYALGRWAQEQAEGGMLAAEYAHELRNRAAGIESASESQSGLGGALAAFEEKLRRIETGRPDKGKLTGLKAWNILFGGVLDGQMYGLAGRPGIGKTAAMEQIICDFIADAMPVTVFERDMSPQKLVERMACRLMDLPYWVLARGLLGERQIRDLREGIAMLKEMPLYIHNPPGLTPERMCAIARRDIRTKGTRCVFIDHIQTFGTGKDIREKLTSASLNVRELVTTTGVPAIVLAHINRAGAKGRPTPEDIKEFDQLLGDVDAMCMLWSAKDRTELQDGELLEVNFYAAKNRDAGVMEEAMLFKGDTMKFVEKPKDPKK